MITRRFRWLNLWIVVCVALTCVGCEPAKESLHEHEHEIPAHWPASPGDAATKIRSRMEVLSRGSQVAGPTEASGAAKNNVHAAEELYDLVTWTPEIVADTDVTEAMWQPIYDRSEKLRTLLEGPKDELDAATGSEIVQLCEQLDAVQTHLDELKRQFEVQRDAIRTDNAAAEVPQ